MPYLNIAGSEIHYIVNRELPGDSQHGDGQKIVYIHGTGCNGRVFERHIRALKAHTVAAIDLSGHGKSSGQGFCGVVDHAQTVAGFINEMNWQGCIVAGHSLGGGIAIATAIYFRQLIKGLILIDTGARLRVAPAVIERAKRVANGDIIETDSRQGFSDQTPQATVDALRKITAGEDPAVTLKDWYADDSCDFLPRIGEIELPTLAVCGRDDQLTPLKYHEFLRDNMPNCKLEIIDDAGHWPFVEKPAEFDRVVESYLQTLD
ncbi:MAG: alpha/beta fold hydrolase [Gammaproteobacteria bacterium]